MVSVAEVPTGTITFLFTDIEGSTARWERYPEAMRVALARHDALLRQAIERHGGYVFKTIGDAFCAAFGTAPAALAATLDAQLALQSEDWGELDAIRVRMALQTGTAELRNDDYFGPPLNRVARLLGAVHGGQVLLALPTAELVRDSLPADASLHDLGDHQLKDLIRPERVFQLLHPQLPSEFPPLRTLDRRPNNLPIQATPLVGRDDDVAAARAQLLRPEVRLLTLTGPGGTGKTRLSLQVAADLIDHFGDGVFFVDLATISDHGLVPSAIAQALDVQEAGGARAATEGEGLLATLRDFLRDKELLLVLDNFEQVLGAAPIVADLLGHGQKLKVLATSRALLHIYGEHDFPVSPLALPDPGDMSSIERTTQFAAVRLFIERAQAARPDFVITDDNAPYVAEICHRLDGLPLAIELAAARVRLLSPQAILSRLERRLPLLTGGARDLPARQQTLRNAIAWGYDILEPAEQRLFRRLSVLAGGFTLEAAEAVGESDGHLDLDVLDGVTSLVEKSFLHQEEGADGEIRFGMLATIREFGLEQLEASGEAAAVHERHVRYFRDLTTDVVAELRGRDQLAALRRLQAEFGNIRTALKWLRKSGAAEPELDWVGELWWFCYLSNLISEGRDWIEAGLAQPGAAGRTRARARALNGAGALAWHQGDYPAARTRLEEAVSIFGEIHAPRELGYSRVYLSNALWSQGDYGGACAQLREALTAFEEAGDDWGRAFAFFFCGNLAFVPADFDTAQERLDESLALFRKAGDGWMAGLPLGLLGRVALYRGDYALARARFEDSLAIRREVGDKWGQAQHLNSLGDVARAQGDHVGAQPFYQQSLNLFRESGSRSGIASLLHNLGYVAQAMGDYGRAAGLFREGLHLFQELWDPRGVAECLTGLAGAVGACGDPRAAARLFGAASASLAAIGAQLTASNRPDY
jgi:predicted ATPase/class 3 adenylate cyclase